MRYRLLVIGAAVIAILPKYAGSQVVGLVRAHGERKETLSGSISGRGGIMCRRCGGTRK
jgi:hypothetical protein